MNKIILLYFLLIYSIGNAQDTIVWDFNSKLDTNLIDRFLKIENKIIA